MSTEVPTPWFSTISSLNQSLGINEDMISIISSKISTILLILAAFLIARGVNYGNNFDCFPPLQYSPQWGATTNTKCYRSDLLFLPDHDKKIKPLDKMQYNHFKKIGYYPNCIYICLIAAVGYLIPRIFWKTSTMYTEVKIDEILEKTKRMAKLPNQEKEKACTELCEMLTDQTSCSGFKWFGFIPQPKFHQLHIVTKSLHVINIILQFQMSHIVFDHGLGPTWGFKIVYNYLFGIKLVNEPFPTIAYCMHNYLSIPGGNIHEELIQCVLPNNKTLQVIFVIHWFWTCILGFFTILDFCINVVTMNRKQEVNNLLFLDQSIDKNDEETKILVNTFVKTSVSQDLVLVFKFMKGSYGKTTIKVAVFLYQNWLKDLMYNRNFSRQNGSNISLPLIKNL